MSIISARQAKIAEQHETIKRCVPMNKREKVVNTVNVLLALREILEDEFIKKCKQLDMSETDIKHALDRVADRAKFRVDMEDRMTNLAKSETVKK